ncbi:lysophospholipid acyltransferase family protein [Immundisolibacter sp.]|uniref:lysophospholipid acyltransferase family protein n=1 Tax=Immundisolibacter sp. TaxID=1934948 RepID=UPI003567BA63
MSRRRDVDWGCWLKAALTLTLMSVGSLAMLTVAVLTAFQARRFYTEAMAGRLGRWSLRLWGIRVHVHGQPPDTGQQCVYISNHTSTLDVFVLIGLGLPNTRFFLSGFLRKLLPLGLIGYLTGVIWTVPQSFPERRMTIFKRAERVLRRSGQSVYLSPEGQRVTTGSVGAFNKGAFHLATNLRAPIVPFYIFIPPEIDPGMGMCARPGRVDVYFRPAIDTSGWTLDEMVVNKDRVHEQFVQWDREYRGR